MTAEKEKFILENFKHKISDFGITLKFVELEDFMDKWKSVVCKEQREICAEKLVKWQMNEESEILYKITKVEILNSPEPL